MLNFRVTTSGCAGATVEYQTASGALGYPAATSGGDFSPKSGQLSWAPGEAGDKTISVDVGDDFSAEPDEGMTLSLHTPDGLTIVDGSARGVIVDNDLVVDLLSEPFCPDEPCLTCRMVAQANAPVPRDTTVYFETRDGTAMIGADFVAPATSVVIPRGATRADLGIRLVNDTVSEPDEHFTVAIRKLSAGRVGIATVTVRIIDDD